MHALVPFAAPGFSISSPSDHLSGQLELSASKRDLTLTFQWTGLIDGCDIEPSLASQWQRADGLWQTTCLEAFWSTPGSEAYWEFNLSLARPLWNVYRFQGYRYPQPPQWDEHIDLVDWHHQAGRVSVALRARDSFAPVLEASLCAVIRRQDSGMSYWSTAHKGTRADFHLRQSMQIEVR